MKKNRPAKLKNKYRQLQDRIIRTQDRMFDALEDPKAILERYQNKPTCASNPDSLYYYRGQNVAKRLGRLALRLEYSFFNLQSDKDQNKHIIESNQAIRDAKEGRQ